MTTVAALALWVIVSLVAVGGVAATVLLVDRGARDALAAARRDSALADGSGPFGLAPRAVGVAPGSDPEPPRTRGDDVRSGYRDPGTESERDTGTESEGETPEPATVAWSRRSATAERPGAVRAARATAPAERGDPADGRVVCGYCGRSDFETAAQRNGHLRWCDEYDPGAPADAAGASGGDPGSGDGGATGGPGETDVVGAYVAVRRRLEREFGVGDGLTAREFHRACVERGLDDERAAALDRLTRAYQAAQYGDEPVANAEAVRAAASVFGTDEP